MNAAVMGAPRFFEALLAASWQAALLVLLVLAVQRGLNRCLTPAWRHALWWIVVGRLLLPATPASSWSLFNLLPSHPATAAAPADAAPIGTGWTPIRLPDPIPPRPQASPGPSESLGASHPSPVRSAALPPAPTASITLGDGLAGIWGLGSLVLLVQLGRRNVRFARRVRAAMRPANADPIALLEECRIRMRVRGPIQLLQGDLVSSPAIYGLFRRRLLLPSQVALTGTPEQLRHIFLHELAHVHRGDLVLHGLTRVLQALHWFNPVLAWAFRRLRTDRELATDALALQVAGESERRAYGLTIVQLLEKWSAHPTQPGTVGILEDNASLERRIRAIAAFRQPSRWTPVTALLLAGLAAVSWTSAQPPEAPKPSEAPVVTVVPTPAPVIQESNRVPVLGDIPWIGRLFHKIPTPDDLPPSLESVQVWLNQASAHQEGGRTADAARAYEGALETALLVETALLERTNAMPETVLALQGIQNTRLSLARSALTRGYLHEAAAHVDRLLVVAPANLDAIALQRDIRDRLAHRTLAQGATVPNSDPDSGTAASTNASHSSKGRKRILARLESIRVPEVKFEEVPLKDVVRLLKETSLASSPDGTGISFFLNPILEDVQGGGSLAVDPNTGLTIAPPPKEPISLGDITIHIDPPLRDIRLIDLLKAITQSASAPLAFTVEDYAVVFQHPSQIRPQLITRVFRVDLARMGTGLENLKRLDTTDSLERGMVPGSSPFFQGSLRQLLEDLGVSLNPPNAVYFNDRQGLLMVRVTGDEMESVEAAVQALNDGTRPWPQVAGWPGPPDPESSSWPPNRQRVVDPLKSIQAAGFQNIRVSMMEDPAQSARLPRPWKPASELPAYPEDRHRPVLIAFEADWAIDSKVNRKVLESPPLQSLFASTQTELFQVDCTQATRASEALQQRYGVKRVPGYAVYHPGRQGWTTLEGVLTPDSIAKLLEPGPSKP